MSFVAGKQARSERGDFLTTPFGAYRQRDVPAADAELTRVGPGTPGGEYLRRFWQPVALSDELKDLPKAIRILGEDLVVFRDGRGRVGLLQPHCSHRGTSLAFGLVSACGIRCCYHGWLFDVDGKVLETPGEPAHGTLKDRLYHGAYPTHEYQGLVFAYLGPPALRPAFPIFDTFVLPGHRTIPGRKNVWPCNWVQIKENAMDPVHLAFLHTIVSGAQFTGEFGVRPELAWHPAPNGMVYTATRRLGDHVWVRMNDLIMPNVHQYPSNFNDTSRPATYRPLMTIWTVPIDDTNSLVVGYVHVDESAQRDWKPAVDTIGQTADRPLEARQRQPGDFDAQTSQGPIAVHALEHLATTDRGVIMFRKLLREGIAAVRNGQDPPGVVREDRGPIRTYSQDTILRIPPEATPAADLELLRETARKAATGFFLEHPST
jgi:nitrite reductase/ring-hydroxylating ferredoxin subunit